jgi:hypothetical protein
MSHAARHVADWAAAHPLRAQHVDCAVAVMLKILDGKCKMRRGEMQVMALLYDAVKHQPGLRLDPAMHALIASARQGADDALRNQIYELRVLAETTISRPVMKAFKAMIREQGLFNGLVEIAEDGNEDSDEEALDRASAL